MEIAERRHRKELKLRKYEKMIKNTMWSSAKNDPEWVKRYAQTLTSHGKPCSCWMCGNCRTHGYTKHFRHSTEKKLLNTKVEE